MFRIYDNLPRSDIEKKEHLATLAKLMTDNVHSRLFDHLYTTLTVLDTKSASLLQFNSIVTAIYSLLITNAHFGKAIAVFYFGLLLSILSSCYLLLIIWVHWSTTDHLKDSEKHIYALLDVRFSRTIRYRRAWQLSVCSFALLVISFILYMLISLPGKS